MSTFFFSNIHILLRDNNITLHMMAYTYSLSLLYENSDVCFPNFGAARTLHLMYDVYTNDSLRGVCFPTVIIQRGDSCTYSQYK